MKARSSLLTKSLALVALLTGFAAPGFAAEPAAYPPSPLPPPAELPTHATAIPSPSSPSPSSPAPIAPPPTAELEGGLTDWADAVRPICFGAYVVTGLASAAASPSVELARCAARFPVPSDAGTVVSRHLDRLEAQLRRMCEPSDACRVRRDGESLDVLFVDAFRLKFRRAGNGIEALPGPVTRDEVRANRARIRAFVLDPARSTGLQTPRSEASWNGGPIELAPATGLSGDITLLRNFVVDLANEFELGAELLAADAALPGAPAFAAERRARLFELIERFDRRRIGEADFVSRLESLLGERVPAPVPVPAPSPSAGPGASLAFRAPASPEARERIAALFDARLDLLRTLGKARLPLRTTAAARTAPGYVASRLHRYVEESGLSWEPYAALVTPPTER